MIGVARNRSYVFLIACAIDCCGSYDDYDDEMTVPKLRYAKLARNSQFRKTFFEQLHRTRVN